MCVVQEVEESSCEADRGGTMISRLLWLQSSSDVYRRPLQLRIRCVQESAKYVPKGVILFHFQASLALSAAVSSMALESVKKISKNQLMSAPVQSKVCIWLIYKLLAASGIESMRMNCVEVLRASGKHS